MHNRRTAVLGAVLLSGFALLVLPLLAGADEIQLGGIRLGQHAMHVIQVFGQPDGVVTGEGQATGGTAAQGAGAQAGGAQGAAMGGGMMGAGMAGPGGGGGNARGGGPGGAPGGMPGGMAGGMAGGGTAGGAGGAGMPGGMPGGMGMGAGGQSAAAAGGISSQNWFSNSTCPDWAAPVWLPMQSEECLYIYRRGTVVIGFLLDRDGYVGAIAVAGRNCSWARTAMGAPKRSVKLGDTYRTVVQRYGYPATTELFTPVERPFSQAGTVAEFAASAGAAGISNASRNVILHYGFDDNIEFTLQDMKVVRIHIWQPDLRDPESRSTGAAAGAGAAGGMGGGMPGAGGQGGPGGQGGGMPGQGGGMRGGAGQR
jgi:hypothetical protein